MRVALLADIHGNCLALEAVLNAARRHGAERLLVAGDLVGYYFWPGEVLELLAGWDLSLAAGNHELMLAKARFNGDSLGEIERSYGCGVRLAAETLTAEQLDLLCGLPQSLPVDVGGRRLLLCHGSPWDIDQYIYPDAGEELLARCASQECDLLVTGHTHYPMSLRVGGTLLVNPGSVGQPRNRRPGAHWALFDTESGEATLCCESYDAGPVVAQSRLRHPDLPYLWEVLERT